MTTATANKTRKPAAKKPAQPRAPKSKALTVTSTAVVIDAQTEHFTNVVVVADGTEHRVLSPNVVAVPRVVEHTNTIIMSEPANAQPPAAVFKKRDVAGGQVMDCHKQWRDRPADEAVFSVSELVERTGKLRAASFEEEYPWANLCVDARDGALYLAGGQLNNNALQQLCRLPSADESGCMAPLDFVTKMRPETAARVLSERLQDGAVARKSNANLLVTDGIIRSIMTEKYERIWDHELAERVADLASRGGWGPAQAFRTSAGTASQAWGPSDKPLPLGWVGDRSMFVCLVDYDGAVTHQGNDYARFFLLSNSEVGAAKLRVTFGLMDFACCNFILWGCHEVWDAEFVHTGNVRDSWAQISSGMSKQLESDTRAEILTGMDTARAVLLGETKDRVLAVTQAHTRLPKSLVLDAYTRAEGTPRYGDPRSVWGMLNGLTEASQVHAQHADARTRIDTAAASLMDLLKN